MPDNGPGSPGLARDHAEGNVPGPGGSEGRPPLEPVLVIVRRWACPHCGRSRSKKPATAAHIERCWLNPAVRSCKTCASLEAVPTGPECIPGRPCNCNDGYRECAAGMDVGYDSPFPVTGCPLWKYRDGEYGGPFTGPPAPESGAADAEGPGSCPF